MSKEYMQALDDLFGLVAFQKSLTKEQFERAQEYFDIIEGALQRLQDIDNMNPNEVLGYMKSLFKSWENLAKKEKDNLETKEVEIEKYFFRENYDTIRQAFIKAQEQEDKSKAFDLINEKDIDVKLLKWAYPSVEAYNTKVRMEKDYWWRKELTKEEFEFIGRMVGAK